MFNFHKLLWRLLRVPSHPTLATGLHPTVDGLDISPLKGARSSLFMPWKEVVRVVAFKRDQYLVDRICLLFELSESRTLEVNEDMVGWGQLIHQIPEYLPGAVTFSEWFLPVAFPAFKTNERTVFERSTC